MEVIRIRNQEFDPDNIKREDMKKLANAIEDYISELESVMIIPDEILDSCEDKIREGIKRSRKLIKKLRNGDKDIFKDSDEWNFIS